jgi:hypothetical protein
MSAVMMDVMVTCDDMERVDRVRLGKVTPFSAGASGLPRRGSLKPLHLGGQLEVIDEGRVRQCKLSDREHVSYGINTEAEHEFVSLSSRSCVG